MKKILLLILSVVLSFSLISCGEEKTSDGDKTSSSQTDASSADKTSAGENNDSNDSDGGVALTLNNTTQFDFTSIALSKVGADNWGKNLIKGTLKARENTTIKIKVPGEDPIFDIQAKATNGEVYVFRFLDLSELELTGKGGNIHLALTEGGDGFAQFSPQE